MLSTAIFIVRDEAIFSGESLLQELKSPWELTVVELQLARKSILLANQRGGPLSPSYTKWFSSSIDLLGPHNGKILVEIVNGLNLGVSVVRTA